MRFNFHTDIFTYKDQWTNKNFLLTIHGAVMTTGKA